MGSNKVEAAVAGSAWQGIIRELAGIAFSETRECELESLEHVGR